MESTTSTDSTSGTRPAKPVTYKGTLTLLVALTALITLCTLALSVYCGTLLITIAIFATSPTHHDVLPACIIIGLVPVVGFIFLGLYVGILVYYSWAVLTTRPTSRR